MQRAFGDNSYRATNVAQVRDRSSQPGLAVSPGMLPGQGGESSARAPQAGEYGFHALKNRIRPVSQRAIYGPTSRGYLEKTQAKRPHPARSGKRLHPGEVRAPARSGHRRPVAPRGREAPRKQKQKSAAGWRPAARLSLGRGAAPEEWGESLLCPLPSRSSLRGSPRCLTPRCAKGPQLSAYRRALIVPWSPGFSKGSLRLSELKTTGTFFPVPLSCKEIVFCHLFLAQ